MSDPLEISALGRLIEKGVVRSGVKNKYLVERFETARWVMPGSRENEWAIRSEARETVAVRLEKLLPNWTLHFSFLRSIGRDPLDANDIAALPMLRRQIEVSATCINRRNWNAAAGLGPKHRAKAPAGCVLTKDWVLRFRPNQGLIGVCSTQEIDFHKMAKQLTECPMPERAWVRVESIAGTVPRLIVTCENIGAYIDFPATDSMLVIYSPGDDIEAAVSLLQKLPSAPWVHFGDLDQDGIDIGKRLAVKAGREFRIFIPSYADEYLEDAARPVKTEWKAGSDIPLVAKLCDSRRRMFQEVFMLDVRLAKDVVAFIEAELGEIT